MALIKCQECGKEVSDIARSCPHCGYELKKEQIRTELGNVETNIATGAMFIFMGIVVIIAGLFMLAIFIGIFAIIGGVAMIGVGAGNISGMQNGVCPYCRNSLRVKYNDTTVKCNHCKNICRKTATYLEKIN